MDTQGLVHGAQDTTANVTNRQGALLALQRRKPNLGNVKALLADAGYTGKTFAQVTEQTLESRIAMLESAHAELSCAAPHRFTRPERNRQVGADHMTIILRLAVAV